MALAAEGRAREQAFRLVAPTGRRGAWSGGLEGGEAAVASYGLLVNGGPESGCAARGGQALLCARR